MAVVEMRDGPYMDWLMEAFQPVNQEGMTAACLPCGRVEHDRRTFLTHPSVRQMRCSVVTLSRNHHRRTCSSDGGNGR